MSAARYRIKERNHTFTPQKRVLWMWVKIAPPQTTMQAASQIIRQKLKMGRPETAAPAEPPPTQPAAH